MPISQNALIWLRLAADEKAPMLDVRSPAEFHAGHIPGAISFPLFSDEERHQIGLTYKQQGPQTAQLLGLSFVGPRLKSMAEEALRRAPGGRVFIHCWRGGMRSASVAWLLEFAGLRVHLLQGGYKAFRHLCLDQFARPRRLRILAGLTGSGKTEILAKIAGTDASWVDLESLAHHRGSAFGGLGQLPPPTQEQFENDLARALMDLPGDRDLWLEDESRKIGRVHLPEPFFQQMHRAPVTWLEVPTEERVRRIVADYTAAPASDLADVVGRLERKLGGLRTRRIQDHIHAKEWETAVRLLLEYYDRTYLFGFERRGGPALIAERRGPPVAE